MKEYPLVSIIILNYKGGIVTERCVKSVLESSYSNFEIILVDNNSGARETKRLKNKFGDKIKIVPSDYNLGYAGGNNLGTKEALGKYLIFLNNDTIVSRNWIEDPINKFEKDKKIVFVQPKVKWLSNKKYFEYAGGAGGFIDYWGFPFARGRVFGSVEEDFGQYDNEREIFWASGVALFTRKDFFKKIGMFDPFFFTHGEEEDVCFRAHRLGMKVYYTPRSVIYHMGAFTGGKNLYRRTFFNHRNHLILLIKNLKIKDLAIIFPVRVLMDTFSAGYYLFFLRSPKRSFAVFIAYCSFLKNLPKIIISRYNSQIKKYGYPNKKEIVYYGSVVFDYFLLKKRRWSEIYEYNIQRGKIIRTF